MPADQAPTSHTFTDDLHNYGAACDDTSIRVYHGTNPTDQERLRELRRRKKVKCLWVALDCRYYCVAGNALDPMEKLCYRKDNENVTRFVKDEFQEQDDAGYAAVLENPDGSAMFTEKHISQIANMGMCSSK